MRSVIWTHLFLVDLVMCADDQAGDGVNYSRRHKKDDGMYQEVSFVSADCAQISVGSCTCDQPCQEAVSFLCLFVHDCPLWFKEFYSRADD